MALIPARVPALVLCLVSLTGLAWAQGAQFEWRSPPGSTGVVAVGDVDGDGTGDFARGVPFVPATSDSGQVEVFSGADGTTLAVAQGSAAGDRFGGRVVGLGDVDQDGRADLAAISELGDYVRAFSGTGATLWQVSAPAPFSFSESSMAGLDDLDLDGAGDLIVVARSGSPASQNAAIVLSGATGAVVHVVTLALGSTPHVTTVAGSEDRDGDGVAEFLVAVQDIGQALPGLVNLYSGSSAVVLATFRGAPGDFSFGRALASMGDLNSDGVADLAVASPSESIGAVSRGRVRLISGADGAVLLSISPDASNLWDFGESVFAFQDLDADGVRDVLISPGSYRVGCCAYVQAGPRVYSGATGSTLYLDGGSNSLRGAAPDGNGDGVDDYFVTGLFRDGVAHDGLILTGWPGPGLWPCTAQKLTSQGCEAWIDTLGTPSLTLGDDLMLRGQRTIPNTTGLFLWSRGPDWRPFRGGQLCLANRIERFPVVPTTSGQPPCPGSVQNTGSMRFVVTKARLASLGFLPGDTFFVQGLFRDPGYAPPMDVGLTGSLSVTVWP